MMLSMSEVLYAFKERWVVGLFASCVVELARRVFVSIR